MRGGPVADHTNARTVSGLRSGRSHAGKEVTRRRPPHNAPADGVLAGELKVGVVAPRSNARSWVGLRGYRPR
jgi:hypothetical protein